jgi:hypothetical protein
MVIAGSRPISINESLHSIFFSSNVYDRDFYSNIYFSDSHMTRERQPNFHLKYVLNALLPTLLIKLNSVLFKRQRLHVFIIIIMYVVKLSMFLTKLF